MHALAMTENGWQAIGRIAKERRERLGLRQDELAQYGGPRVSTVGKFERAAQESFPLRTQHQMEKALGWSRTIIEQVVSSIDSGELTAEDWEFDLVHEDVPDMSRGADDSDAIDASAGRLEGFAQVFSLIPAEARDEAMRAALLAIFPFLDARGASALGRELRDALPPNGGDGNADADAGGSAPTSKRTLKAVEVDEAAYDPEGHDKK